MRINRRKNTSIIINKNQFEDVTFKYLESIVRVNGCIEEDVQAEIRMARTTFSTLNILKAEKVRQSSPVIMRCIQTIK